MDSETTRPDLWRLNEVQFPRLLAEIMATCELPEWDQLCETMDLTSDELASLFDRAQSAWETIKTLHPDQIEADLDRYGHIAAWRFNRQEESS